MYMSLKEGCLFHGTFYVLSVDWSRGSEATCVVAMRVNVTTWVLPAVWVCAPCLGKGSWATTFEDFVSIAWSKLHWNQVIE
jgi:hypothetical protein